MKFEISELFRSFVLWDRDDALNAATAHSCGRWQQGWQSVFRQFSAND